jgi:thiol-disulfide isomerase/thioredoxin
MAERLIFAVVLLVVGLAVYEILKRWHLAQIGQRGTAVTNIPTILYFGSDHCAACPTQVRYLELLNGEWHGRVAIQHIDAEREPEKASQYRVFTLPTTILVDALGQVREINYGLTNSHKLSRQVGKWQVGKWQVGK